MGASPQRVALAERSHAELRVRAQPRRRIYRESDEELFAALGHQAALATRNLNLSTELAERLLELEASRQRIVQAQEAGRRCIERDIHDGVQQQSGAHMTGAYSRTALLAS
jgi:hypothetical protein